MSEHHLKIGGYPELDRFSPFVLFTISPVNDRNLNVTNTNSEESPLLGPIEEQRYTASELQHVVGFSEVNSIWENQGSVGIFKVYNLAGEIIYNSKEFPANGCFQLLSSGVCL
jgi:hypothetical protein